jgi:hypothetical protein
MDYLVSERTFRGGLQTIAMVLNDQLQAAVVGGPGVYGDQRRAGGYCIGQYVQNRLIERRIHGDRTVW